MDPSNVSGLRELLEVLRDYQSPNTVIQKRALKKLEHLQEYPNYVKWLLFILCHFSEADDATRCLSGIILKRHVKKHYDDFNEELKSNIRTEIVVAIGNQSAILREIVAELVSAVLVKTGDVKDWPELLPLLEQAIGSAEANIAEGAMNTLSKIFTTDVELCFKSSLLPRIVLCLGHHHLPLRAYAIQCIGQLMICRCPSILNSFESILECVCASFSIDYQLLREAICTFLLGAVDLDYSLLSSQFPLIVQFMIICTLLGEKQVAVSAGSFWCALGEKKSSVDLWRPHLQDIIPVLLKGMRYEDSTVVQLVGDRDYDSTVDKMDCMTLGQLSSVEQMEEDREEDDDKPEEFNLRKGCAAALDLMACILKDDILEFLLPQIKDMLPSEDCKTKEVAILAMGAVAEGCPTLTQALPQIIPNLILLLAHDKPLIRAMTCWTLSRYAKRLVEDHKDLLGGLMIDSLLKLFLDRSSYVKKAALSAFCVITENTTVELVPYVNYILETLSFSLKSCPPRSLPLLCDAIGTLVTSVDVNFNDKKYIEVIMPPLMEMMNVLGDGKELRFLLDAMSSLASKLKSGFLPYCPLLVEKCNAAIASILQQPDQDQEVENLISHLDLLSGMAEGLQSGFEVYANNSDIVPHLVVCLKHSNTEVRQSAYALLGDLAPGCFSALRPHVGEWMPLVKEEIKNHQHTSTCNNAVWSLGSVVVMLGEEAHPHVNDCLPSLEPMLSMVLPATLLQNVAITICKFGLVCPEDVAPKLARQSFLNCYNLLHPLKDNEEKESAFLGLFRMITFDPNQLENACAFVCLLVDSWINPTANLKEAFELGMAHIRAVVGEESFQAMVSEIPNHVSESLSRKINMHL